MVSKKDTNPKDAIGCKKPPLSTVPMPVLFEVGTAMLEGACKYRRHNYRAVGVRASIYFDAAMRHLALWWEGEDDDPDSGLNHITKAIAGLVVLRDAQMRDMVNDDRPPRFDIGATPWMESMQDKADMVLAKYSEPLPPYTELEQESLGGMQEAEAVPQRPDNEWIGPSKGAQEKEEKSPEGPVIVEVRGLSIGAIFATGSKTFKVTKHSPLSNIVEAVGRIPGGSYTGILWRFPGAQKVEFKGAGR